MFTDLWTTTTHKHYLLINFVVQCMCSVDVRIEINMASKQKHSIDGASGSSDLLGRTFKGGRLQRQRAREELARVASTFEMPTLWILNEFDSDIFMLK